MIPENYRANVGIMIINQDGLVWMGRRVGAENFQYQWQMPQGGIDEGETPLVAAWRELYEETGLTQNSVQLIAESDDWLCYTFPEWVKTRPFLGQCQKWFLFRLNTPTGDFKFDCNPDEIEFNAFQWVDIDKIADMVVPFKKHVYQAIVQEFKPYTKKES